MYRHRCAINENIRVDPVLSNKYDKIMDVNFWHSNPK